MTPRRSLFGLTILAASAAASVQCGADDGGGPRAADPTGPDAVAVVEASSDAAATARCFLPSTPHASGSLDVTFGARSGQAGGYALTTADLSPDDVSPFLGGIAVDGRGRIVAALTTSRLDANVPVNRMTVAGWNADGDVDPRFGAGGMRDLGVPTSAAGGSIALAVAVGSDDRTVVAGTTGDGIPVLVRLASDGSPDATFGPGGIRTPPVPSGWTGASFDRVAIDADGRISATAHLRATLAGGSVRQGVGVVGASANVDDIQVIESGEKIAIDSAGLVITEAGATVAVSRRPIIEGAPSMLLARFVPGSGAPPTRLLEDAAAFPVSPFVPSALGPGAGGTLFVLGGSRLQAIMARVDSNGALDTSFGDAGVTTLEVRDASIADAASASGSLVHFQPMATLRHSSGSLYVSGALTITEPGNGPFYTAYGLLLRLTDAGTLDASFGTGGIVVLRSSTGQGPRLFGEHHRLSIAEDRCRGRILVGGDSELGPTVFALWP